MTPGLQTSARGGPLLTLVALLLLVALLATLGKPVPRREVTALPPASEVLRNPQYALGLLAERLGSRVETHAQLPAEGLPPAAGGTLWLAMPGQLLGAARVQEIRQWVEAGGTLVIAPAEVAVFEGDPLAALGEIEFVVVEESDEEGEGEGETDAEAKASTTEGRTAADAEADADADADADVAQDLERNTDANVDANPAADADTEDSNPAGTDASEETAAPAVCDADGYRRFGSAFPLGDGHYAWAAPREDVFVTSARNDARGELCTGSACHAQRIALGNGEILALADPSIFNNAQIGHLDHALLARNMLSLQPGTTLWIVHDETVPGIATLIWQHAKAALFSALAALVLWLLAASGRFGPLLPSPVPQRRRLAEHVQAAGEWLARQDAQGALWQGAHDAFWRRFLRRHPQARDAGRDARIDLLARHSGLSREEIIRHLHPPASTAELPAALQRIAFLRKLT
jgi:hypothetical protein